MKKNFLRFIFSIILILFFSIIYLSTIGIETKRFNQQINTLVKNLNNELEIELRKIKIVIDPLSFQINAKTLGPKLKIKNKIIELENIKSQISIKSLINNQFSLKNLNISTKSIQINNLISFSRIFKNSPELYILEKIIRDGYLISEMSFEFDAKGNIKNNYKIEGLVKNAKVAILKKYDLKKIDFIFDLTNKELSLKDTKFLLNDIPLIAEEILIKDNQKSFLISGTIETKNISSKNQVLRDLLVNYFSKLKIFDVNMNSKNSFSFEIDKKFKVKNYQVSSVLDLKELKFKNEYQLDNFFPNLKEEIIFNNHQINLNLKKNNLLIKGKGDILLQDKLEKIDYNIKKKNQNFYFETNLSINKNPFLIKILEYEKNSDKKANINLKGSYIVNKKLLIEDFSIKENNNEFIIKQLETDRNLELKSFKKINLKYSDKNQIENKLTLTKKKGIYYLTGSTFNINGLIDNIIESNEKDKVKLLSKKYDFRVKVNEVYLDKDFVVNNLKGSFSLKKNKILAAELNANFSKDKILKFTVNSNQQEKVTTLYLDKAEPLVKRYKFIKGYKGGSLDFYSSQKNGNSNSNLKLYDFKLTELPILTKLLTLASLQGIADILSGEGITFDEFEMSFNNKKNLMTIDEMYAIGPAISILMNGYIEKNKIISLRGSLVPATTINKAIGTIPVLGKILVGSKTGEGVFGVSFKIKGPPKKLETTVNPIKTLTPRFITRTLEKIKKN